MEQTDQDSGVGSQGAARRGGRGPLAYVWEWAKIVGAAILLFLFVRTFVVEAFKIPTSSMEKTLLVGDFLLVNKAIYGADIPGTHIHLPAFEEPRRGDVIVFVPPMDPTKNFVKRLVGVPGDTLEMRDTRLYVNGFLVNEPYARYAHLRWNRAHRGTGSRGDGLLAGPPGRYHLTRDTWGPIVVPPNRYFVLGDNRDNSDDSRYFGFVPRDAIRGRPWLVYYSYDLDARGPMPWLFDIRWNRIGKRIH